MKGICGNEQNSDVLVTVDLNFKKIEININSKLKVMFGRHMEIAVREVLEEMDIKNIKVDILDFGALDFVIKARTKTAIKRALLAGGN
jgi:citrate lyase subunit gamma (acyl carrier protein)